jgi:hypothetical protein
MNRELDGMYFRIKRCGRTQSICFSDMTEEEQDYVMNDKPDRYLKRMCKVLASKLREIGDTFDILGGLIDE